MIDNLVLISIQFKALGSNTFFILSAKKTEDGLRGLDRTIKLDMEEAKTVERIKGSCVFYNETFARNKEELASII